MDKIFNNNFSCIFSRHSILKICRSEGSFAEPTKLFGVCEDGFRTASSAQPQASGHLAAKFDLSFCVSPNKMKEGQQRGSGQAG